MDTQTAEILIDDASEVVALAGSPGDGPTVEDGMEDAEIVERLVPLVEGLLFAAGAPVPVARLVDALDGPERRHVLRALDRLGERLEAEGRGLRLVRVAGGYQLRTLAEHAPWVRRILGGKPPRLSRAMLETLAIIAYRQPCTRPEMEAIRGVDVDAVLTTLVERRLVRILGRKEAPGRPLLYATTKEFLEVFGLPDLAALPPLPALGELADALAPNARPSAEAAGDEASAAPGETPDDGDGNGDAPAS